jgi:E3 Ubiquitin ligase
VFLVPAVASLAFLHVGLLGLLRYMSLLRTTTLTCAELTAGGPSSAKGELTGTAHPGSGGMLTAPFSGTACVWYAVRATYKRRGGAEHAFIADRSELPFDVWDGTGSIEIRPEKAQVDGLEKTFDEKLPPGGNDALPAPTHQHDDFVHFHYEEWTLPSGSSMYVRGRAIYNGRSLFMEQPGRTPDAFCDPYVISARGGERVRRWARWLMLIGYGGALLVVLAGALVVIEPGGG